MRVAELAMHAGFSARTGRQGPCLSWQRGRLAMIPGIRVPGHSSSRPALDARTELKLTAATRASVDAAFSRVRGGRPDGEGAGQPSGASAGAGTRASGGSPHGGTGGDPDQGVHVDAPGQLLRANGPPDGAGQAEAPAGAEQSAGPASNAPSLAPAPGSSVSGVSGGGAASPSAAGGGAADRPHGLARASRPAPDEASMGNLQ